MPSYIWRDRRPIDFTDRLIIARPSRVRKSLPLVAWCLVIAVGLGCIRAGLRLLAPQVPGAPAWLSAVAHSPVAWVCLGALAVLLLLLAVCPCMLSSLISRREERERRR